MVNMDKNRLNELDDAAFNELMAAQVNKTKKQVKTKQKRRKNNTKLFEQLMEKDLKEKGYIK